MESNLAFDWAVPGDLPELEAFVARHYGPDSIQAQADRVRWLFFDNPRGLHVTVCRSAGEIVACCGHLPEVVVLGGQKYLAGFGVDFMVAPAMRRQGIGRQFLDMRLEKFDLSLSMGQSSAMGALYRDFGAKDLGPLFLGEQRRKPPFRGGPRFLAKGWLTWARGLAATRDDGHTRCRTVSFAAFFSAMAGLGGVDNLDWLRWRFQDTPYRDYRPGLLESGGSVCGGFFYRPDRGGLMLVELSLSSADRRHSLAAIVRSLPSPVTRFLFAGTVLSRSVQAAGFRTRPYGARLLGIARNRDLAGQLAIGAIDLTCATADADLIRTYAPPGAP
jgi:GNAT superfamily N-acetyltransferase